MQVNSEVYGARSTWRRDAEGFSNSSYVPDDMQFKRGQYNRLMDYVSNSKLSYGQPIDYSICYAAHGEGMPLASLRTWYIPYINGAYQVHTYKRNKQTGWFFGHQITNYSARAYEIFEPITIFDTKTPTSNFKKDYWLPEGVAPSGTDAGGPNQQSAWVIPIVEFPTRGVYFGIQCTLYKASSAAFENHWLSELQSGDWSAYKLVKAVGILYTYNNSDGNYTSIYTYGTNRCGICANEMFEFSRNKINVISEILSISVSI